MVQLVLSKLHLDLHIRREDLTLTFTEGVMLIAKEMCDRFDLCDFVI